MNARHDPRRVAFLVGLLVLLLPLPFFSEFGNPNNITRALLTSSIVESGSTRIDPYHELTSDKALYEGHYYSDKAPGMALLAVPSYAAALALAGGSEALGFIPEAGEAAKESIPRMLAYRLMILTTSGLLTALAAAVFYLFALRITNAPLRSLLATLTAFLATPILGWSVNFFGHAAAGAVLFLGFFLLTGLVPGKAVTGRVAGAGFLLGLAMIIEYTTAPAAALIGIYGIWRLRPFGAVRAAGLTLLAFAASLGAIGPLMIYHTISFGGPLSTGYSNVVGFEGMEEGFMGLTRPNLWALISLSIGPGRGIIWMSPVLVVLPWALWGAWRAHWMRAELVISILVATTFVLLNISYHYWNGGYSMGPRHMTPAIPFLGVSLIWLWSQIEGRSLYIVMGLLTVSIALNVICAATTMTPHTGNFPVYDQAILSLLNGDNWFLWFEHLGIGLMPLLLGWAAMLGVLSFLMWKQAQKVTAA